MEIVWKLYGYSRESDTFMENYDKISLEIVWSLHGENMANKITRQSPYLLHHKIFIKSNTLHTVSILSTQFLQIMETKCFLMKPLHKNPELFL